MVNNTNSPFSEILQQRLEAVSSVVGPNQTAELIEVLNLLRDAVIHSATGIAGSNPGQFQRFLDTIRSLSCNLDAFTADNARPVEDSITKLRQSVQELGFGKFVNYRTGRQEKPED